MTSVPLPVLEEPVGIIVRLRQGAVRPIRSWAFLWAWDEDGAAGDHWHERVPVARNP